MNSTGKSRTSYVQAKPTKSTNSFIKRESDLDLDLLLYSFAQLEQFKILGKCAYGLNRKYFMSTVLQYLYSIKLKKYIQMPVTLNIKGLFTSLTWSALWEASR